MIKQRLLLKLNPLNSLFGRIFLWFWLTTIIIILSTFLIIKHVINKDELLPIPANQQARLIDVAERLKTLASRADERIPLPMLLSRISMQEGMPVILLDPEKQRVLRGRFPFPKPFEQRFLDLQLASSAFAFRVRNHVFFGPELVSLPMRQNRHISPSISSDESSIEKTFLLFIGEPIRPGFAMERPKYLIILALAVSGSLSFLLAWSLTRPIQQLRSATQKMAHGDLSVKVENNNLRRDEIGQLSQDFNAMSDKVAGLMNAQKRLLADVSHELRSPLARLQVAIGIAQQNEGTESPQLSEKLLDRIEKEANKIDEMLAQVLQLSKLDSENIMTDKQDADVAKILASIVSDARYEAKAKGIVVEANIPENARFFIDPTLLGRAFDNVLRNAVKYASENISVFAEKNQDKFEVVIEDDGPGIPENDLISIFEPFYRVSTARNRETGGTGLGLAIAKQAISAHNGNITISNKQQGGLSVKISIPNDPHNS